MAHWRTMTGNRVQFDVADLPGGKPLLVQIEAAKQGEVDGFLGGRKEKTRVVQVRFVGYERPLGFKPTLSKSMVRIYGTGEVEHWVGKWLWLVIEMVNDPNGGPGAKCEAVRIRPIRPTDDEIAVAVKARGGSKAPAAAPERDDAGDQQIVAKVCSGIEAAKTEAEVEAAIAPHREDINKMARRLKEIVASAKRVALDAMRPAAAQEGATDGAR